MESLSTSIFRLDIHGRHNREVMFQSLSNCGNDLDNSKLPTQCGDMLGAKGNSGDMVIKVLNWDNRRSEVSYKDKIWAQRLGNARQPHR